MKSSSPGGFTRGSQDTPENPEKPGKTAGNQRIDGSLLEFFPIKLVGGFIAIDNHLGCVGCSFCLSRRHEIWQKTFSQKWEFNDLFQSADQAMEILSGMKPFTRAHIPLRIGHNTDSVFQWDFGVELYKCLPEENPCIFLTRFPIPEKHLSIFQGQPNLLVKMTITPSSASLGVQSQAELKIGQIKKIPLENLFVLIGPITHDNWHQVPEIIDQLPPGLWIDIKPLTREGIPGMSAQPATDARRIDTLRQYAVEKGLKVTDYFGCLLRKRLKRPFYKAVDAPEYIRAVCDDCEQHDLCFCERRKSHRFELIRSHAADIGIIPDDIMPIGHRAYRITCAAPTGRGDETYLSEMIGARVHLSTVPCGSEGGTFDTSTREMLDRWEKHGVLPVTKVADLAQRALEAWTKEVA